MYKHKLLLKLAAPILIVVAGAAVPASLQSQEFYAPDLVKDGDRWEITAFNDESPTHVQWATQGICFRYLGIYGTSQRYLWWSDTFPDWNGIASQEGDEIVMHGDYAKDVGHDGMRWSIVTSSPRNMGAGHWWEWRENGAYGRTIGFANARLVRAGYCKISMDQAKLLPLPVTKDGRKITLPMGYINVKE